MSLIRFFIALAMALAFACDQGASGTDASVASGDGGTCDGCLDETGTCRAGDQDQACGFGGRSCAACGGGRVCDEGACVTPPSCGPDSCDGCCDGDTCVSGTADTRCGAGGAQCASCAIDAGGECVDQACELPCGPDNCAGCCDGDVCVAGDQGGACGYGGQACTDCAGDECSNGVCVAPACFDSCSGCCSGTTCLGGNAATACGAGGEACVDCGPNRLCDGGECVVDPNSRWDVVAAFGEVNETNLVYQPWDSFGGLPDPYVYMITSDSPDLFTGESDPDDNTLSPYWTDIVLEDVPARALKNYFYFRVYDSDLNGDDDAGQCAPDIDDASFSNTLLQLECPRDVSEGRAGWTVWYRIRPH